MLKMFGVYALVALTALIVYLTGVTHLAYFGILAGWVLGVLLTIESIEVFRVIKWIEIYHFTKRTEKTWEVECIAPDKPVMKAWYRPS